tara:strand:+ start:372 stop:1526 length:1155 start_codon:yes stop_codon:yes gene_type:complete
MATTRIWDGTAIFSSGSSTPFGLYDSDGEFQLEAPKTAKWCAKRMGYPIVDIELNQDSFFACFEEAVSEYGAQINFMNIKDNLLQMRGSSTTTELVGKNITPSMNSLVNLSHQYGTEAGVGGKVDFYSGSIAVTSSQQVYNLDDPLVTTYESGTPGENSIEVKRVFHQQSPAVSRIFDPLVGSGMGSQQMIDSFGFGSYAPGVNYMMMPMNADLLRVQAVEFNDTMRKSAYSFELVNNKLKIFPIPDGNYTMHFHYIKINDRKPSLSGVDSVSDFSDIPYNALTYSSINDAGKQWIRKYALANSKELLGTIRSKYGSIPIPGAETTLDGDTLRSEAATEKSELVTQLREDLELASKRNLMEREKEISEFQQELINRVPLHIYIG